MTKEQTIILQAMKSLICGTPVTIQAQPQEWAELLREAWLHTVLLPFYEAVQPMREQIPERLLELFDKKVRKRAVKNMQLGFAQAELVALLEGCGIPYVILKGEASAAYYPNPELRQLGDVDFIVPKEQIEPVRQLLLENGYEQEPTDNDHHIGFCKGKIAMEMHTRIAGMPEGKFGDAVNACLQDLFASSQTMDLGSGAFRAPGDAHQAVILLLHMQHHMVSSGMGLRHIMDWACFLKKTADSPIWQDTLLPLFREIGLLRFAAAMTKMAAVYMGSPCPDWAREADDGLCQGLMEDILAGGDFGRKDRERARAGNMLPDWKEQDKKQGKLSRLYTTLKNATLNTKPQLRSKPIRLFFGMVGKALRYIWLRMQGKRPSLFKAASYADSRKSLYDQLKMYEKN